MNTCIACHKILSKEGKTSLCITCFNKARVGSMNPSWKGGVAKKTNPKSKFLGHPKSRMGAKNPMFGRKHSDETKRKISATKKRMRISRFGEKNSMFGKKHSAETKRKIGMAGIGRRHSDETKEKMRVARIGEKNPMWKGDSVHYEALHEWIKRRIPKPEKCVICNTSPPRDLANISGEYKRELSDWEYLCRSCHMKKDGRGKKGYVRVDRTSTYREREK